MLSRQTMRALALAACWLVPGAAALSAQGDLHSTDRGNAALLLTAPYKSLRWSPIFPELRLESPRIAFLRVDSRTGAAHLLIRVPKNFHVPLHWHSANETHTVLDGEFIVLCAGQRDVLRERDFNYIPKKMPHEAWTRKDGALLYITVDGPWDVNWVNGPPTRADMLGGRKNVREEKD